MKQHTFRAPTLRAVALVAIGTGLSVSACGTPATVDDANVVTLVTHDSFVVSDGIIEAFERESGYTVKQAALGDAGTLVNQLVLTKGRPLGDAVFGIDNTFAGRAIEEGVLEPYTSAGLAESAAQYLVGDGGELTPIDVGDVCVNVHHEWFTERGLAEPEGFEDLTDPAYRDLLVVENPATSSPGLAFLLATVGAYGDDWPDYWALLRDNGIEVASSWTDAYEVDFSGSQGLGPRPLVVSYSTSPAITMNDDGASSRTRSLLDTCFRQVEYAGVLADAANPEGARALVDFLASETFQSDIPGSMYMYPADADVALSDVWAQFAPLADEPFDVPAQQISTHREEWIEQWTDTVIE